MNRFALEPAIALTIISLLLVWRHESNIRKLLAGTESRIGKQDSGVGIQDSRNPLRIEILCSRISVGLEGVSLFQVELLQIPTRPDGEPVCAESRIPNPGSFCSRIAAAKATIAPLSVQNSSSG